MPSKPIHRAEEIALTAVDDETSTALEWPAAYSELRAIVQDEWGVDGEIYLNRQLSGGKSGALVYTADLSSRDFAGQVILKFDTVDGTDLSEEKEFERHQRAIDSAPEYAEKHIERLVHASFHENKVALISTIAGKGVEYVQPWSSCSFDLQFAVIDDLSSGLLESWNASYTLSKGLRSPQRLVRDWLQHRIKPETSRLFQFLEKDCGLAPDEPTFTFDGKWYPNPVAFAVGSQPVPERTYIRAVKGNCHGDLHGLNVLVLSRAEADLTYSLIDLAMYEPDQYLFYDHAYFEVAHLLNVRGGSDPVYWTTILEHLMEHNPTGLRNNLNADDLGFVHLLGSLRGEMYAWIDRHEPNRLSYMESQYLLARVAAGLNFANKHMEVAPRRLALLYAAFNLKLYLRHQGIDWPKYGPLLAQGSISSAGARGLESSAVGSDQVQKAQQSQSTETEDIAGAGAAGGLPDHPTIAVLPFQNLGGAPDGEFISDGIAVDIITQLSRIDWLTVIARGSSFSYRGKVVDPMTVGRELGVRYVVDGTVSKVGNRLRITAQLQDAVDGHDIWSSRFDSADDDVFTVLDEIAESVVAGIDAQVRRHQRLLAKRKPSLFGVWEHFQRALGLFLTRDQKSTDLAITYLERTLAIDPNYSPALSLLALIELRMVMNGSSFSPKEQLDNALELASRAVECDDSSSLAHSVLGLVYSLRGVHEKALVECFEGVDLNPSSSIGNFLLGASLLWAGRAADAVRAIEKSARLSPKDPYAWMKVFCLGVCHYFLGDFAKAEQMLRRAEHGHFIALFADTFLALVLERQDRHDEAMAALGDARKLRPELNWGLMRVLFSGMVPDYWKMAEEDARKIGLIDG